MLPRKPVGGPAAFSAPAIGPRNRPAALSAAALSAHGHRSAAGTVSAMASAPSLLVATEADGEFVVKITDGKAETRHVVSVPNGFGAELGLAAISGEDLVRASFLFLLDREPATSILAEFSLELISRYFPEYRHEIRKYL